MSVLCPQVTPPCRCYENSLKGCTGIAQMEIRPARDTDVAEITSIFNYEVEHSTTV